MQRRHALAAFIVGFILSANSATAQGFPDRPIKFVVPFPPGNTTDTVARLVAEEMGRKVGQPVIVENHGGGNGMVGAVVAAGAPADGYTVLISTNSIQSAAPFITKSLPIDPIKAFAPVGLMGEVSQLVIVPSSSEAKTLADLIAIAKTKTLTYATPNTISRFAAEQLGLRAGIEMKAVPYKVTQQALNDISTGDINVGFIGFATAKPYIDNGTIRALANSTAQRAAALPDLPTVAESFPGYFSAAWFAAFVPAGTPADVVTKLNDEITNAIKSDSVSKKLAELSVDVRTSTAAELDEYVKSDIARWAEVTKASGWEAQ